MVTPIWKIQRELEYAQARQNYYSDTTRPVKTTVDPTPRSMAAYRSLLQKVGETPVVYRVNVSEKAVTFFGELAALGLLAIDTQPDALPKPPGFKPAMIKAMAGDATPVAARAFNGTGRRYVKYSKTTTGAAQAHYQAPISGGDATPTWDEAVTKFKAIATDKKAELGNYGRIYIEPESFSLSGR